MDYIFVIKTAFLFFPLIAFLITIPYILREYHKYGSVYWLRVLIVFSFVLYLMTSYFLVILPLPKIDDVAILTTPTTQLIPFMFILDFVRKLSDITSLVSLIKTSAFYVPLFNLFLFIPFGIYLRYYFKLNLKRTFFFSLLLSLFFEITQLTGLYYLYPRGYRLFDVDDLIVNTLGGVLGYFIGQIFTKFLPSREQIDNKALKLGEKVSLLRRFMLFVLDLIFFSLINSFVLILNNNKLISLIIIIIYYIVVPSINKGKTIMGSFLNVKIASTRKEELKIYQIILRQVLFFGLFKILSLFSYTGDNSVFSTLTVITVLILILFLYLISFFKIIFKKEPFYEKLSQTKLASTISDKIYN